MKRLADPFLAGLILMVIIAWWFPGYSGVLRLDMVTSIGVAVIFFLFGIKLDLTSMLHDLKNWRLHLSILSFTYGVFPVLILLFYPLAGLFELEDVWMALFFLACLPSAIASAVMLVNFAGGNVPGAIVSASVSGFLGILITPALMGLFLHADADSTAVTHSFAGMVSDLSLQILLPLIAGLLLNKLIGTHFQRHADKWTWFDKIIIWLIIYKTFSSSFISGVFVDFGIFKLSVIIVAVLLLFFGMLQLSAKAGYLLKFATPDRYTLNFCGSTKSLIHGSIMAAIIFGDSPGTGIYILPILLYHPLQLIAGSFIAQAKGKN